METRAAGQEPANSHQVGRRARTEEEAATPKRSHQTRGFCLPTGAGNRTPGGLWAMVDGSRVEGRWAMSEGRTACLGRRHDQAWTSSLRCARDAIHSVQAMPSCASVAPSPRSRPYQLYIYAPGSACWWFLLVDRVFRFPYSLCALFRFGPASVRTRQSQRSRLFPPNLRELLPTPCFFLSSLRISSLSLVSLLSSRQISSIFLLSSSSSPFFCLLLPPFPPPSLSLSSE
jgi:hypothetical protein